MVSLLENVETKSPEQIALEQVFVERAKIVNPETLCIDVSDVNVSPTYQVLSWIINCWMAKFKDLDINAVVGLPNAGKDFASPFLMALGQYLQTKTGEMPELRLLASKKLTPGTTMPATWKARNSITYATDSFTSAVGEEIVTVEAAISDVYADLNIAVFDDCADDGSTAIAALSELMDAGAHIACLGLIFVKESHGAIENIKAATGVDAYSIIHVLGVEKDEEGNDVVVIG